MKRLYNTDDLQKMLTYLKSNKQAREKVLTAIDTYFYNRNDIMGDKHAIHHIIESGFADTFDRYDSEVSEKFISITESVFGTDWHLNGFS